MNKVLALALLLAAHLSPLHAQDAAALRAVPLQAHEHITLDGTLSHPAWQRAPVYSRFVEKDPVNGAAPVQATQVQVLFDEQALYVGITALDTHPEYIRGEMVRTDLVNRTQDFVSVFIDAIGSRRSAQFFRVNAAGSLADGMYTAADDNEDFAPDFDWDAATARNPQGWTAVLRLPFASLRFAEGPQQAWRILVVRRLPREQFHLFVSNAIPRDAPSFIDTMQPLQGVVLPSQHQFLSLRPSLTLRQEREDGRTRTHTDASLDLKWRPRAELVIDGTLNPDFSQVALDVPQLAGNTRYALSFPEKRPFFLESADLLRSPTEAFYTRTFTRPRWGLRGTWRSPELAGSLFAMDDRGGGQVLLPGAYGTDVVDQPASRTLAARLKAEAGGGLQWGGTLAARRYADAAGDNDVLGPDVVWQISDAWRLRGQWLHSKTDAFTGGRTVDGDRVYLRAFCLTDRSELNFTLDDLSSGFRHDSGFVNQVGVRKLAAFGSYGWPGWWVFNEFNLNLDLEHVQDRATGRTVQQLVRPGLYSTGANNMEWWLELHARSAVRVAPTQPLLQEHFVASGLTITPARWFPLLDTTLNLGRLADTVANRVRPGGRLTFNAKLRPLARLELEPSLSLAWFDSGGQRVYRESAAQWLAVWHFDARRSLRAIVQDTALDRVAEPGVDRVHTRGQVSSLTYAWRESAGTVLYIGASSSHDSGDGSGRRSEAFVKLQIDVDEWRPRLQRALH